MPTAKAKHLTDAQRRSMVRAVIESGRQMEFDFAPVPPPMPAKRKPPQKKRRGEGKRKRHAQ
jgi:hypothetical protein